MIKAYNFQIRALSNQEANKLRSVLERF